MPYTENFSEVHAPLARINPQSTSGQLVTAWVSLKHYARAVAVVHVGAIAANRQVIVRLEQATDTLGSGQKVIAGHESDTLLTADENGLIAIELRAEELDVNNLYDCVALKVTAQGGAVIVSGVLYGTEPRYAPVDQTLWEAVID